MPCDNAGDEGQGDLYLREALSTYPQSNLKEHSQFTPQIEHYL